MEKGDKVIIKVKGSVKGATIVEPPKDGKVRVRPEGFPFDMTIKEEEVC